MLLLLVKYTAKPGGGEKFVREITDSGILDAVRAEDGYAALFTAAKHWGYKFTRPEYHQNARATKLHYTPDTRPGALV